MVPQPSKTHAVSVGSRNDAAGATEDGSARGFQATGIPDATLSPVRIRGTRTSGNWAGMVDRHLEYAECALQRISARSIRKC